jgi:hypothetical protein
MTSFGHPLRMPRSKGPNDRRAHVAVRLEPAIVARVDALLFRFDLPGRRATRSDGLRAIILAGLGVYESPIPAGGGDTRRDV